MFSSKISYLLISTRVINVKDFAFIVAVFKIFRALCMYIKQYISFAGFSL